MDALSELKENAKVTIEIEDTNASDSSQRNQDNNRKYVHVEGDDVKK